MRFSIAIHLTIYSHEHKKISLNPNEETITTEWKKELSKFEVDHFPWVCPWYFPKDTILSCGEFSNVPLMGPRGCVAYTPAIMLQQLKWTQVVPKVEELGGLSFQYTSSDTNVDQAKVAFNNLVTTRKCNQRKVMIHIMAKLYLMATFFYSSPPAIFLEVKKVPEVHCIPNLHQELHDGNRFLD
ncbi:hypothetical protein JHK85_010156 [Glycine max]|nr:hypothetical protein JHK85_010156 [Glycine max]